MKQISKKSMKKPNTNSTRLVTRIKPSAPPGRPVSAASIIKSPSKPRKTSANKVLPINSIMIIEQSRAVSSAAAHSAPLRSRPRAAAMSAAPAAPTAPASVGVAIPTRMLPRISTTRAKGGNIAAMSAAAGGRATSMGGARWGRRALIPTT